MVSCNTSVPKSKVVSDNIYFTHFNEITLLHSALAKNVHNQTGTGGGKGERRTDSQQTFKHVGDK